MGRWRKIDIQHAIARRDVIKTTAADMVAGVVVHNTDGFHYITEKKNREPFSEIAKRDDVYLGAVFFGFP